VKQFQPALGCFNPLAIPPRGHYRPSLFAPRCFLLLPFSWSLWTPTNSSITFCCLSQDSSLVSTLFPSCSFSLKKSPPSRLHRFRSQQPTSPETRRSRKSSPPRRGTTIAAFSRCKTRPTGMAPPYVIVFPLLLRTPFLESKRSPSKTWPSSFGDLFFIRTRESLFPGFAHLT